MADIRSSMATRLTGNAPPWVERYLSLVVGTLFGCAAIGLIWLLGTIFANHHAARSWVAVPAEVLDAEIRTSRSGTGTRATFNSRIKTAYRYRFAEREYAGERVDFGFGSDNFADRRRDRQMAMLQSAAPVVYVNPARPEESVLDRSLPVEQVNFGLIFLFFPCGLGTVMMLAALVSLAEKAGLAAPGRYFGPVYGLIHTLPAFYAPLFAPAELGPFGWLLAAVAAAVFLVSVRAFWRRWTDPDAGLPVLSRR